MQTEIVMGFDAIYKGAREFRVIPINPEEIRINGSRTIELINLIDAEQMSSVGPKHLQKIEFSSFYPSKSEVYENIPDISGLDRTPDDWVAFIEELRGSKSDVYFFIWTNPESELAFQFNVIIQSIFVALGLHY